MNQPLILNLLKKLSHESEELHLILNMDEKVLFANNTVKKWIENIERCDNTLQALSLTRNEITGLFTEKIREEKIFEFVSELHQKNESTTVQWRILADADAVTFIGKNLGNKEKTEGDKFAQALQEVTLSEVDENYVGNLTEIQRVLSEDVDKFKLISENVSDVVCLHEPKEVRYLYVSPSCKEVTGYTPAEMEGRSPYDFFHPDMIKALEEDHRKKEAGELPEESPSGPPPKIIYLLKTKDRGFRWMESHSRPIFDKTGKVILILSTSRDVHEREEAERENKNYQKKLIQSEIETTERERSRIAKELHDGVGTNLTAIKLRIGQILKRYNDPVAGDIEDQFQFTIKELKDIIYGLVPSGLERYGLFASLKDYIDRLNNSTEAKIELNTFGAEIDKADLNLSIFRIIQELLSNSIKHSHATRITIHLNLFEDLLSIVYEDNGVGFAYKTIKNGLGLNNIESRVQSVNGALGFESGVFGVSYTIDIPVPLMELHA